MSAEVDTVMDAVEGARRNYGEDIDYDDLVARLEAAGWVFQG